MFQHNEFISQIKKGTYKQQAVDSSTVGTNYTTQYSCEGVRSSDGVELVWTEFVTRDQKGSILGHLVVDPKVKPKS